MVSGFQVSSVKLGTDRDHADNIAFSDCFVISGSGVRVSLGAPFLTKIRGPST
jgi:hypothetical protein